MDMQVKNVRVEPLQIEVAEFLLVGSAPYVQNRFSSRVQAGIRETQAAGSQSKKGKARQAKDFAALYKAAQYISAAGWHGQPCAAYRNAFISACRVCGFAMTRAKMSIFIEADGHDAIDGTPLIRILKGKPRHVEHMARNDNGSADIRVRAMFDDWSVKLRVRYDAGQFSSADVANLVVRAGVQVGVGEGRPDSKDSAGMGWGTFAVAGP